MRQQQPTPQSLAKLAHELESIHPANLHQGAAAIMEFCHEAISDPGYISPYGDSDCHSALEDEASVILAVWRDASEGEGFPELLETYKSLLNSTEKRLPSAEIATQLQRIRAGLGMATDRKPALSPAPSRFGLIMNRIGVFSGLCLGLLIWLMTSDHMAAWQISLAILAIAAFGGLLFRLGQRQRLQTPVESYRSGGGHNV